MKEREKGERRERERGRKGEKESVREFKRDYWLLYNYDKTNMDSHLLTSSANAIIKRLHKYMY